jgi:hypothetical protein
MRDGLQIFCIGSDGFAAAGTDHCNSAFKCSQGLFILGSSSYSQANVATYIMMGMRAKPPFMASALQTQLDLEGKR